MVFRRVLQKLYITFNHVMCSNFSGFVLQGVNRNRCQFSVFYLTASLICGGYCYVVIYHKSIFTLVTLLMLQGLSYCKFAIFLVKTLK